MALLDLIGLGAKVYSSVQNSQNRGGAGSVLSSLGVADSSVNRIFI